MEIRLIDAGKRFNRDWIFKNLHASFSDKETYAITGHNGSGKSTLLQCIAGSTMLSEGEVIFNNNGKIIPNEEVFSHVSICAPYLEVIEEMTALEFFVYHQQFKSFHYKTTIADIIDQIGLSKHAHKQIRYFSSGMKQRIKLAQAFFSETPVLLLDEPCTNLDQSGIALYKDLLSNHTKNRIVIISSNDQSEIEGCTQLIQLGV
ncbi:MAG: ATP-binding cassette domain-containing protein [Bacteroidota bacterium]|jgi:ABC-type multidrug transport system ATPase subunit